MSIFEHPSFDNHEQVDFYHDDKSGLKAIIAVHNTHLGAALGGCRMWPYPNSQDALTDVLRLSKGMTYKAAMAGLPQGGGKAVIIGDPKTDITPALMHAMGDFINSLSGKYITAEDSGMSTQSVQMIGHRTEYVSGIQAQYSYDGKQADGNPSPATAYGVFKGIEAAVAYKLGKGLNDISVLVQGVGQVGYRLAELLHASGAELLVSDVFSDNAKRAEQELGAKIVHPDQVVNQSVDVYAPCAFGAVINDQSLDLLKCKIVAGAANNQLAEEYHGEILRQKDILYAPDYVINGGGIIDIYHQRLSDSSDSKLKKHLDSIAETLTKIFVTSDTQNDATNTVANLLAEERFAG